MNATNIIHWANEAPLLGYGESDSAGAWLKFRVTPEDLEHFRGLKGTVFYLTTVEIANDGTPVVKTAVVDPYVETGEESQDEKNRRMTVTIEAMAKMPPIFTIKPHGKKAASLYANGFFLVPKVLEAIGSDAEFLEWIRKQPCAVTGERDYHTDEATGIVTERCDAAHVRTVAAGAGTAIKPLYSAIPLIHSLHDTETKHGKSALYFAAHTTEQTRNMDDSTLQSLGKDWMDKLRDRYVVEWANHKLAKKLGYESMGFAPPHEV